MGRRGPKPIEIDQTEFEKLCALQCTLDEIADFFDCSEDTVERWVRRTYKDENGRPAKFAEVFRQKRARGKISLRRYQWQSAKKSVTMQIWLGKQYLGQRDLPEDSVDMEDSEAYFNEAGI